MQRVYDNNINDIRTLELSCEEKLIVIISRKIKGYKKKITPEERMIVTIEAKYLTDELLSPEEIEYVKQTMLEDQFGLMLNKKEMENPAKTSVYMQEGEYITRRCINGKWIYKNE